MIDLLIKHDDEGGRLLALAPPPGREPQALLRLSSLGAYMLAIELMHQNMRGWVRVPAELVAREGPGEPQA